MNAELGAREIAPAVAGDAPVAHISAAGQTSPPMSPKDARANLRLRLETVKVFFGGGLLVLITILYGFSLWNGKESNALLAVLATGIGYLFGGRGNNTPV
jgi:hypothetical protein